MFKCQCEKILFNMKKNNFFNLLFLILWITGSCQSKMDRLYSYSYDFFPKGSMSHFPDINSIYSINTTLKGTKSIDTSTKDFSPHYFMSLSKLTAQEFKEETEKIRKLSLRKFSVDDSNQILITQSLCLKEYDIIQLQGFNDGIESKRIINQNIKNAEGLPLPLFNLSEFTANTYFRLNNNFVIYLLEAKSYKTDKNYDMQIVPDKWESGLSRGYAISDIDKCIIYWIVIW